MSQNEIIKEPQNLSDIPLETIEKWIANTDPYMRAIGLRACKGREVPYSLIEHSLTDENPDIREEAIKSCVGRDIPIPIIEMWLSDEKFTVRRAAMYSCKGRNVPSYIIERGLVDTDRVVREAAVYALNDNAYTEKVIKQIMSDKDCMVRRAAFLKYKGKNIPLLFITLGIKDSYEMTRVLAFNACIDRDDIPLEYLIWGLSDKEINVRDAAARCCKGKEKLIRYTGKNLKTAYIPCHNGVIATVIIPADAYIRRTAYRGKYRINKFIVTDIIGTTFGQSFGIAYYDDYTCLSAGDCVNTDDFDYGFSEYNESGFPVYARFEQAKERADWLLQKWRS